MCIRDRPGPESESKKPFANGSKNDEILRHQIREALSKREYSAFKPSVGSLENSNSKANSDLANARRIDEIEKRLYQQELQIQALKNDLYQSNLVNENLRTRVLMLEDQLRVKNALTGSQAHWTKLATTTRHLDKAQSAPSSSSTSEWLRNTMNDAEDTRVLLGWKQQHINNENRPNNVDFNSRKFSNLDDSTTKLINLAGQPKI